MKLIFTLTYIILLISCSFEEEIIIEETINLKIEIVASGFKIPWGIEIINENEYLFTERYGELLYYKNGTVISLNNIPKSETVKDAWRIYGGLMDVSLHPNFNTNNLVYISYVNLDFKMVVARFTFQNETIQNLEVIFKSNSFSIGSRISWQDESHFFVTQGLGGDPYPVLGAQNIYNDGGKIHRLNANGTVPEDNPILIDAIPSSIWSYGHRDPQGLYYDTNDNILYSNEHGPLGGDELNIIKKGGNYGWPLFSYGLNYDETPVSNMTEEEASVNTVLPIKYWGPEFNIAPSSLLRLKDSTFKSWNNTFLIGSLAKQSLVSYNLESKESLILIDKIGRVRDIAVLHSGNILLLIDKGSPNTDDSGRILKLTNLQF